MPDSRELIDRGIRLERGGVLSEALRCYQDATIAAGSDAALRAEALRHQADIMRLHCEWSAATSFAEQSFTTADGAGLDDLAAEALNARGAIEQSKGRVDDAIPLYRAAHERARDPRVRACALQNLGALAALHGDYEEASRCFAGSLDCFLAARYERGTAIALNNLGRSLLDQSDYERAQDVLSSAVTQARLIEDLDLAAVAMVNLAEALTARGDLARADEEASAALGFFKVSGNRWRQVECLKILGDIRRARKEIEIARRLYEQARLLAEAVGETHEAAQVAARLAALEQADPVP